MVVRGIHRPCFRGFGEYLLGGNREAGPERLDAGLKAGKPYILSPCGFDMIRCGPIQRKDRGDPLWRSRRRAQRLNTHGNKSLVKFIIPVKGFSSLRVKSGAPHDSESARAFVGKLRKNLDPGIEVIEADSHFNTPEFADAVVNKLDKLLS